LAREEVLSRRWKTLAVALPPCVEEEVADAIELLPAARAVLVREPSDLDFLTPEAEGPKEAAYVPVEPTQAVIAALRTARQERIAWAFCDLEVERFESRGGIYPDAYALKRGVSPAHFAAAVLPSLGPPPSEQARARAAHMAARLKALEAEGPTLFLCSFREWPWVRQAYVEGWEPPLPEPFYAPVETWLIREQTLAFVMGELPFIAHLYEERRQTLGPDEHLSVDGIKELILEARDRWVREDARVQRSLSPQRLALLLKYVRNLTLTARRLTPDLYSLALASKQVVGDAFAIQVVETAQAYPYQGEGRPWEEASFGLEGRATFPSTGEVLAKSLLPGQEVSWRRLELTPPPPKPKVEEWKQRWNPHSTCSYPPEDAKIESFRNYVQEQSKAMIGADLARSEKFTTSLMDGLDIRETIRHWYSGDLYVKRMPPSRGSIEVVVFLFEVPADPKVYPWRCTWYAEHDDESTLSLFATNYQETMVGPGIGQATYGGCLFIYPPRPIPEIWQDPRIDFAQTLEERMIGAAALHSRERHIALVSPCAPKSRWRRIARAQGKKLIHLPLSRFSQETVERLRRVHVLNGHEIRSFASEFIREG